MTIDPGHRQQSYSVRFDWGPSGARAIAGRTAADVAVVVDVLSFTTTVSVALDVGTDVVPWKIHDESAAAHARDIGAVLAVRRRDAARGDISLSPATLRAGGAPPRLVLPSPNGSTISAQMTAHGSVCVAASLRNARAVASWIGESVPPSGVVSVVAAGERWEDGSLRPSIEDLWGAGYLIARLARDDSLLSPEARVARDAWNSISPRLPGALFESASGIELSSQGYRSDVEIAAEIDSSAAVPVLRSGIFVDARSRP